MRKTTLNIDDEVVAAAAKALGTKGLKATVDKALDLAISIDARRQMIRQLRTMEGLELDNPEVMRKAWG